MHYQKILLALLANLLVLSGSAQTIIKIPFVQNEVFVVEPRETDVPYENGESIQIGSDMEIHGGSGDYSFSWLKDGNEISTQPTIIVEEKGEYTLTINDGVSCEATSVYRVGTSSGIKKTEELSISLYPNPARDNFHLKYNSSQIPEAINIYSVDGQLIKSSSIFYTEDNTYTIDVSELSDGYYYVVSVFKNNKITKVLLKQK